MPPVPDLAGPVTSGTRRCVTAVPARGALPRGMVVAALVLVCAGIVCWQAVVLLRAQRRGPALEIERKAKTIVSGLDACPEVYLSRADSDLLEGLDFAEICITSGIETIVADGPADAFRLEDVDGVAVRFAPASGTKCARCWQILGDVGSVAAHPGICVRCADAVGTAGDAP